MSVNNIPFLAPSQVTTPPPGHVTPFYDTTNGNVLSWKDSDCNICVVGDASAPDINIEAITECICQVLQDTSEKLACSAAKGTIPMADFQSYISNFTMYSTVDVDPSTNSFIHGITGQPVLFVQLSQTNVLCNGQSDGTASAVISGGTPPYNQTWEVLGGGAANPAALAAGVYTLTVTDANNITKVKTFVITEPSALGITVGVSGTSPNASASANVTGGTLPYTYEWRDNGGVPIGQTTRIATSLSTGTYQVHVTDANGCTIQDLAVNIP